LMSSCGGIAGPSVGPAQVYEKPGGCTYLPWWPVRG
jgi:hypothetical protein